MKNQESEFSKTIVLSLIFFTEIFSLSILYVIYRKIGLMSSQEATLLGAVFGFSQAVVLFELDTLRRIKEIKESKKK